MKKYINNALLLAVLIGFSGGAMADHHRRGHGHNQDAKVVQAPSVNLDVAVERARAKGHRVLKAKTRTRPNGKQVHILKVRTRKGVVKRIIVR